MNGAMNAVTKSACATFRAPLCRRSAARGGREGGGGVVASGRLNLGIGCLPGRGSRRRLVFQGWNFGLAADGRLHVDGRISMGMERRAYSTARMGAAPRAIRHDGDAQHRQGLEAPPKRPQTLRQFQ